MIDARHIVRKLWLKYLRNSLLEAIPIAMSFIVYYVVGFEFCVIILLTHLICKE